MKRGKIIRKFKSRCLNCKKEIVAIERESISPWCRKNNIRVANFYCSKKCEKKHKEKLNVAIIFTDGYEKAKKDILKKLRETVKEIKNHVKEMKHPDKSYHQGSIDILEVLIKSIKKS
jgi:hypothetical protein